MPKSNFSSSDIVELIENLLQREVDDEDADIYNTYLTTKTFEQAMLLTGDKGLVLNIGSAEFQITVLRVK